MCLKIAKMRNLRPHPSYIIGMVIGVLDSGIGGLNVLCKLISAKIANKYVYLADNANIPYGSLCREKLIKIAENGCRRLIKEGADIIVLACNTLSVTALPALRQSIGNPIFGLVPDLMQAEGYDRSLLLATPATIIHTDLQCDRVTPVPLDRLAAMIENDYPDMTRLQPYLQESLSPYRGAGAVILGCSHYIYMRAVIQDIIGCVNTFDGTNVLLHLLRETVPKTFVGSSSELEIIFSGRSCEYKYRDILLKLLEK